MIDLYVYGSSPTLQELCLKSTDAISPLLWSTVGNLFALTMIIFLAVVCLGVLISGLIFSIELGKRGGKKLIKEFF